MLMEAFGGELGVEPVLFAAGIIAHIGVTHGRQFTGGVLRGVSSRTAAVDDHFGVLIRNQRRCLGADLIWRQVLRPQDMSVVVGILGQRLEQDEVRFAVELLFQLVAAYGLDRSLH